MLVNKKYFLTVVAGSLFVFNCAYAQTVGYNQGRSSVAAPSPVAAAMSNPASVAAVPSSAKNSAMGPSSLADAQLMDTINKSMSANKDQQSASSSSMLQQTKAPGMTSAASATSSAVATTASPGNSTQIELELNKKVPYKIFYLNKPERLVVDIKDSSFSAEFDKSAFANSPIKNIRSAHRDDGVFRVVFDLKEPVTFQHSEQAGSGNNSDSMKLLIAIAPKEVKNKTRH